MFPMNRQPLTVTVEYDANGPARAVNGTRRTTKTFSDAYAARRWFTKMYIQQRNPSIVSAKSTQGAST